MVRTSALLRFLPVLAVIAAVFAGLLLASPAALATTAPTPPATSGPSPTDGAGFQDRISGVLRNEGSPVPGVRVTARGEDGYEAQTETTQTGSWTIGVPVQGTYEVELDESTLPEGMELADGQRNPREVTFAGTSNITTLFLLGEGIVLQQQSFASALADRAVAGLSFGLLLALSAVGLSLIFGTTGLTNFAHGEMVTIGAVLTFVLAGAGVPLWLALILAVAGGALLGYTQDAVIWKPLRRRGTALVPMMIVSIGLAVALRYTILFFFGGGIQQLPDSQTATLDFGPFSVTENNLRSLAVSLVVILIVAFLLLRTRIGKATRAVADNAALAAASGIDVDRVIRIVWVVGGALAALGGILWAYYRPGVSFNMGQQILLMIFAGVTLGGLGTVFGALIGSIVVGLFVEISTLWLEADLKYVGALVIMILVLLIRPQGILGRRERIG